MSLKGPSHGHETTSTGIDEKFASVLTYFLGFITGILFLIVEKKSRLVRLHAMQSTLVFGGLFILNYVLGMIPLLGWLIWLLLGPVSFILWLFLMWKGYQGVWYKLPYIGDFAEKQIDPYKR